MNEKGAQVEWRGYFVSTEINALHAAAFGASALANGQCDWWEVVNRHSLGWVVARQETTIVGFANVPWDGFVHAWLQDIMVAAEVRGGGIGTNLVEAAAQGAGAAGCEWLHVDFDDSLGPFYFGACGFTPTTAGLLRLL